MINGGGLTLRAVKLKLGENDPDYYRRFSIVPNK